MIRIIVFLVCWLQIYGANASVLNDAELFAVDMAEVPPDLDKIKQEYRQKTSSYNWKYDYRWNMPDVFDAEFGQIIRNFGSVEKRIDNPDEESILRWLDMTPKEYYPYIGPLLHTMRGISGKVLDKPGIKETKNKFPQRIASVFEDVPDIEFASPELYIYLMPEIWGDKSPIEYPKLQYQKLQYPHKIRINPQFVAKVLQNVNVDDFALDAKPKVQDTGTRHFFADRNTPLSKADVKAFVGTLGGLKEFMHENQNEIKHIMVDSLISYQDIKNGKNPYVTLLTQQVNPCQTIVRKVKWLRQYSAFQAAIGDKGFGMDDWAYICDRTIKAYRVYKMPAGYISALNFARKDIYWKIMQQFGYAPEELEQIKYHNAAFIEMYSSNGNDVEAIKPYAKELEQMFFELGGQYGGTPLILP